MEETVGENVQIVQENDEGQKNITMKFDQEWVQVLINLRMKYSKLFTRRRNSASDGWKLVFEELKASGAPSFITITKIKKKWMNLMTRFRQIKNSALSPEKVTWPYFDQMNRAFGKDSPIIDEQDRKYDTSSLLNSATNDERQNFIKKLIQLRHSHKHLFTGRKYTARDGWIIIRSLLQCDDKYTVEQLSKCWQNLAQRYKQLSKSETNITWPYFQLMNSWYNAENNITDGVKIEMDASTSILEQEENDLVIDKEKLQLGDDEIKIMSKNANCIEEILLQITKMREVQEIRHREIISYIKSVQEIINKIKSEKSDP